MKDKNIVGRHDDPVAARAAGWYARLHATDCTAAQRREFDAWLSADERHRAAYEAASRAATKVSEALRFDPRLQALLEADEAAVSCPPPVRWRRIGSLAAAAAGLVLAVLLVPSLVGPSAPSSSLARIENADRREKTVTLADGSIVHLDAGAVVTAELLPDARRLSLLAGRAYFEVAHDAARPFSVEAFGTRTVALGTRFEVRLSPQGVTVTLAEGSVAITPTGAADWKQTLSPGQQLVLDTNHPDGAKLDVDASQVTAWSRGRLVFDGQPLSAVLEEVNRYSDIKVVLGDDRLAATPIGGTFAAGGDAGAFVQALSAILPVRSEPSGDNEIVLYRRERPATSN
jgi:transmembrane sensor